MEFAVLNELIADGQEGMEIVFKRVPAYDFYKVLQQLVEELPLTPKEDAEDYQRILETQGSEVKVERMVLLAEIVEHESSRQDNIDILFIDCYVVQINEYLHS